MKKIMLKSIKIHAFSTTLLTVLCILLLVWNVAQGIQYHCTLDRINERFEQVIDEQTDKYLELVKAEEPMKTNYPKRSVGNFQLSFYTPHELGRPVEKLHTATGTRPKEGRTIAVDRNVIPLGSTVYIEGFGYYIAEDTGGAIKGNRIDVFLMDYNKARQLGRRSAKVWVLGKE